MADGQRPHVTSQRGGGQEASHGNGNERLPPPVRISTPQTPNQGFQQITMSMAPPIYGTHSVDSRGEEIRPQSLGWSDGV